MDIFEKILLNESDEIACTPKAVFVENHLWMGWYYIYQIDPETGTIYLNGLQYAVPSNKTSITNNIEKIATAIFLQEYLRRSVRPKKKPTFVYFTDMGYGTSIMIRQEVSFTPLFKKKKFIRMKDPYWHEATYFRCPNETTHLA